MITGLAGAVAILILLLTVASGGLSLIALLVALLPRARRSGRWAEVFFTALSVLPPVMAAALSLGAGANFGFLWLFICLPLVFSLMALRVYSTKTLPKQEMDSYEGPRCVSCAAPIASGVSLCPKCGWTRPA
jgi:hypothetical protein